MTIENDRFEIWQLCGVWKLPLYDHRVEKSKQNCVCFAIMCINLLVLPSVSCDSHPKILAWMKKFRTDISKCGIWNSSIENILDGFCVLHCHVVRLCRESGPGRFEKSVELYDESADAWEVCFQLKESAINSCVVALWKVWKCHVSFLNVTDSAYDGSVYAEACPIQSHFPKIPTEQFCVSAVITK